MVLHSDFPAIPLRGTVLRVMDRSFDYHPKKADGSRDETRTEHVNRNVAIVQYIDVQGVLGFCLVLGCRDWRDCRFDGLVGREVDFAVVGVSEDRNTAMPIFSLSGFEPRELKQK